MAAEALRKSGEVGGWRGKVEGKQCASDSRKARCV